MSSEGKEWFERTCMMLQSSPHTAQASTALVEFRERPEALYVAKQVLGEGSNTGNALL
jgi:hypothetical protein